MARRNESREAVIAKIQALPGFPVEVEGCDRKPFDDRELERILSKPFNISWWLIQRYRLLGVNSEAEAS